MRSFDAITHASLFLHYTQKSGLPNLQALVGKVHAATIESNTHRLTDLNVMQEFKRFDIG
jgi:hypothetical protein